MNYELSAEAERDLEVAVDFYNASREGLGDDLLDEFHKSLVRIAAFPEAWTPMSPTLRRHLLNRFPYSVIYSIEPDRILILAVMHMHRMPREW